MDKSNKITMKYVSHIQKFHVTSKGICTRGDQPSEQAQMDEQRQWAH